MCSMEIEIEMEWAWAWALNKPHTSMVIMANAIHINVECFRSRMNFVKPWSDFIIDAAYDEKKARKTTTKYEFEYVRLW